MELRQLILQLEHRRRQLGMSCADVASRSQLGLRTVQRALSGEETSEFSTLEKIAHALGASLNIEIEGPDVDAVKREQAESKASRLVSLTQGTSALEAQAVPEGALKRMKERTAIKLLSGSPRKLWAD
ncbi:MAG TPA: helix-turn-helix transcriptional regulator [Tepidisphaeraceae bacterium]|nr:helix-turn-helix transcriptional regulator [Tepidisphaeraceae bacterium]